MIRTTTFLGHEDVKFSGCKGFKEIRSSAQFSRLLTFFLIDAA
jgi:hypothetical protein